jgi:ribonucrease Y
MSLHIALVWGCFLGAVTAWTVYQLRRKNLSQDLHAHHLALEQRRDTYLKNLGGNRANHMTKQRSNLDTEVRDNHHRHQCRLELNQTRRALHTSTIGLRTDSLTQLNQEHEAVSRKINHRQNKIENLNKKLLQKLATLCTTDLLQFKKELGTRLVQEHALYWQRESRTMASYVQQSLPRQSRRILAIAQNRHNTQGHLERLFHTIPITSSSVFEALSDHSSTAYQAYIDCLDCPLIAVQGAKPGLKLQGDDPVLREIARRSLRQMANGHCIQSEAIQTIIKRVRNEVGREIHNAAKKALFELGLSKPQGPVFELIGRLKFRLSYSQNQWKHAIEVGHLAGLLAAELGLDVGLARRGGLLHDIGKALSHERDGGHAVLGAQVARQCGEEEIVAHCIGAHHGDEEPVDPLAYVVAAADALSGARPGARREATTAYLQRIEAIHTALSNFTGIDDIAIMNGGRDVNVRVQDDIRDFSQDEIHMQSSPYRDSDLYPLAQDIARALEEKVIFPGQIKVTVVRESRSIMNAT